MTLELFGEGGIAPRVIEATRILIRDDHGNPIVFAARYLNPGDGLAGTIVSTLNDPQFETVLATIGVAAARIRNRIEVVDESP